MSAAKIPEAQKGATEEQTSVQKLLIENGQLIETIAEYQRLGRPADAMRYHELLHKNLLFWAASWIPRTSSKYRWNIRASTVDPTAPPPAPAPSTQQQAMPPPPPPTQTHAQMPPGHHQQPHPMQHQMPPQAPQHPQHPQYAQYQPPVSYHQSPQMPPMHQQPPPNYPNYSQPNGPHAYGPPPTTMVAGQHPPSQQ
ncbi:SSXT domain-containing protein [Aphelenchoides fujianensis]|nr:SSXT domain-containing protein [Aphelenchoides fujianensis]